MAGWYIGTSLLLLGRLEGPRRERASGSLDRGLACQVHVKVEEPIAETESGRRGSNPRQPAWKAMPGRFHGFPAASRIGHPCEVAPMSWFYDYPPESGFVQCESGKKVVRRMGRPSSLFRVPRCLGSSPYRMGGLLGSGQQNQQKGHYPIHYHYGQVYYPIGPVSPASLARTRPPGPGPAESGGRFRLVAAGAASACSGSPR